MNGSGPPDDDDRPVPGSATAPALATGLAAFAIGNGLGELALPRETRGAVLDWGGLYAQGVRLTGRWTFDERTPPGGSPEGLPSAEVRQGPGAFRFRRGGPRLLVDGSVTAHPSEPRLLLHRRYSGVPSGAALEVTVDFAPMLAPVLLEGIRPVEFRFESGGSSLRFAAGAFAAAYDAEPMPSRVLLDGRAWLGGRRDGPLRSIRIVHELRAGGDGTAELRIVVGGGRRGRFPSGPLPSLVDAWAPIQSRAAHDWIAGTPTLEVPGAPDVVRGYDLARRALRTLYTAPEPGFQGLLAGFPWYAALWCRDLARMLPAVLWMGDASWAAASLDTVFAFQSPGRLDVLGASPGELPMQVSPGPVFLFGTSDTSLYYPGLVRRYIEHTDDPARATFWLKGLEGVRRWAEAKADPSTGLFRNGDELEPIRTAARGERVQLGVDAVDTTIWDSADRRRHAVDLQGLWIGLHRDLARLASVPGAPRTWEGSAARADRLAAEIPGRYGWAEESYLYDSLDAAGAPVPRVRPNALQWVGSGLLAPDAERRAVERALRPDLTTPWGVRTLSDRDPAFDPTAYHMGQVWPIATAWLARAALRAGPVAAGGELLERLARQIASEGGWSNECYRGDRPEPFNSCFLLGFSIAPFLSTIFEGAFGLSLDAPNGTVHVRPADPLPWGPMSIRGLRVGGGRLDLAVDDDGISAAWDGPAPLVVAGPEASVRVAPGSTGRLPTRPRPA